MSERELKSAVQLLADKLTSHVAYISRTEGRMTPVCDTMREAASMLSAFAARSEAPRHGEAGTQAEYVDRMRRFDIDAFKGMFEPSCNAQEIYTATWKLIDAYEALLAEVAASPPPPKGEALPVAWRWRNPGGVWNYQEDRQRIPNVEQEALARHARSSPGVSREEVARAICGWCPDEFTEELSPSSQRAWFDALAKADRVLALLSR